MMLRNQRGLALVITLLVVALLAITVVEFTYSVEIDQRMARNAVNGVQASLLARSGIALGEAFLLRDDIRSGFDAFTEEWCPSPGPDAQSCLIDESNSPIILPQNMRLRVQIIDEAGKFNVNLTRPSTMQLWQQCYDNPDKCALAAFERLTSGVDPSLPEALMDYWRKVIELADQAAGVTPDGTAAPQTPGTDAPVGGGSATTLGQRRQQVFLQYEFNTLDDLGVVAGMTPSAINRLRPVLSAVRGQTGVNVNTAPREVLSAICDDGEWVERIISERQSAPIQSPQPCPGQAGQFGARPVQMSTLFLIRASAIINPDPMTGRGGIRRSATMLVQRGRGAGGPQGQRWILKRLDWQKEGGAFLFDQQDDDRGVDDSLSSTEFGR